MSSPLSKLSLQFKGCIQKKDELPGGVSATILPVSGYHE
jgi:hypothetical protein